MVADGDPTPAEFHNGVESEHSAMSACCGYPAPVGARTFTATASQGRRAHARDALHSLRPAPAHSSWSDREPCAVAPLSIWGDQSDVMAERDCG